MIINTPWTIGRTVFALSARDRNKLVKCPGCNGEGKREVVFAESKTQAFCPKCDGKGKVENRAVTYDVIPVVIQSVVLQVREGEHADDRKRWEVPGAVIESEAMWASKLEITGGVKAGRYWTVPCAESQYAQSIFLDEADAKAEADRRSA